MKSRILMTSAMALALIAGAAQAQSRGNKYDYDAGAKKESRWPELFAATPNYRAFGKAVIGGKGEKFRWKMGPMWYRGRLEANKVKVFIIGQEGAQDENVSNRSFTGSTGTRMQKFLNYLGINQSYLFMNTFVYTINGQYSLFGEDRENPTLLSQQQRLLWLAQNEDSIVVKHRHDLFDYMLETNNRKLDLVIGVGTAGKDSVATWFQAHGEKCRASDLTRGYCLGKGALRGVLGIAVRHPGAASARNGGSGAVNGLVADFQKKANIVANHIRKTPGFLPKDPGAKRNFSKDFKYGYAAIPHRDFFFGTNWRMGARGTTSNRRGSHTVQVFSSNGCYNNGARVNGRCSADVSHRISYDDPRDLLSSAPAEMAAGDVPYESPKSKEGRTQYDYGPGKFAKNLMKFGTLDYNKLGITQHKSFGPNGMYRGRLDQAKILVIADQVSHTDFFSGRALTGAAGQRLQSFLTAAGATKSYGILRTLPVDSMDLSIEDATAVALDDKVFDARMTVINQIIQEGNTDLVIAVGPVAEAVVSEIEFDVPVISMKIAVPGNGHESQYKSALANIKSMNLRLDKRGSFKYFGDISIIPRADLPAYTRWWMGTTGDRAARAYEFKGGRRVDNGDYYKLYAPRWATKWKAVPSQLRGAELESLRDFRNSGL